jgi:hypothetical protein
MIYLYAHNYASKLNQLNLNEYVQDVLPPSNSTPIKTEADTDTDEDD